MRIGIVSDSHGRAGLLRRAVAAMTAAGAEAIVHCGDIGSTACMDALGEGEKSVRTYAVSGNMDRHVEQLAASAELAGVNFQWEVVQIPLPDGQYMAATHGNDQRVLSELVTGGQFPYVCHGHTHRATDEKVANVRVICPGALAHPKSPRHPAAAVLDTETGNLEYLKIS